MASSLSQHEAAAKALELDLLSSHTRTDYELIEQEGKKLAKLMSNIASLDKDIRRKILGPVLTEFSAEYMEARKAIRGGEDPKAYKFNRRWEVLAKGKAPEQRPNLPVMDLTQVTKKKAPKPREAGPSKPAIIQPADVDEESAAGASSNKVSFNTNSGAQPSALQGLATAMTEILHPTPPEKAATAKAPTVPKPPAKAPAAPKPPAKAPAKPKPPAKAPAKPKPPAKAPAKAKKAAASTTKPAKGPEPMDVDQPETAAGGSHKAKETDKQRREKGEAEYNPDDDSGATDYADEPVGGKRKVESGKKGGRQKKFKSVTIIVDSDEDVPLAKGKGKAAASKASTSTAAVGKTAAKASTSTAAKASTSTAAKASTSTAAASSTAAKASRSTAKAGTAVKLRSNFRKYLDKSVMARLDAMLGAGKITAEEEEWYVRWTKALAPKFRPIKALRDNTPRAVVLMGQTLIPPQGLNVTAKTCDWCMDFAPMRCFVLDQGTACLMCNIFRKRGCTLNGEKVNPYHGGPRKKGETAAGAEKTGGNQGSATRKPAAKPAISKKAAEVDNPGGAKAPTTKPAAKSGPSTSKLGPDSRPTSSADAHAQALDEVHATQAKHAASIRSIQSQMDAMALGMAACGSLLKTAQEDLRGQATETRELEGMVAEGSTTLADAIARLEAARGTELPTDPTSITHDLIETHLNNLGELIQAGARFSELFVTLATDVTNTTRALSEWLTGSPDVEMRGPEDEDNDGGLGEESDSEEEDLPIEYDEDGVYRVYSDMDEM